MWALMLASIYSKKEGGLARTVFLLLQEGLLGNADMSLSSLQPVSCHELLKPSIHRVRTNLFTALSLSWAEEADAQELKY